MDTISVDGRRRKAQCRDTAARGRNVEEELEGFIRVYNDGSVERFSYAVCNVAASEEPEQPVASKDAVIDSRTGVWARFYLPRKAVSRGAKLPLVIYFHGGGFVLGSPAWSIYHAFMCRLASETQSMIMSVAYRLAPENRLPAAYDDCFGAVTWLRQRHCRESSWLASHADLKRCFLGGDSAGGNIAHHVALRCAEAGLEMRGVILLQPFFGGPEPPVAVAAEELDPNLSQRWVEVFWNLALPVGAKRDYHPACNPLSQPVARFDLPPLLVCVSERDVLRERNMDYCHALKSAGKSVRCVVFKGVGHAFQVLNPDSHQIGDLTKLLNHFIHSTQ